MAQLSSIVLRVDQEMVDSAFKGARAALAGVLRSLPRVTESDGSVWIDAKSIDEIADKFETA